ncbi:MAG: hypothetical protein RBU30_18970 [Polyangia bacterium]|jgi:hypothetical protein|nr:hypothetical protein [Polyangia bacterium]
MSESRRQRRAAARAQADGCKERCEKAPFVAWEEESGFGLCFPAGEQGWVPLETWQRVHRRPGQQAQLCICLATGQTWVKLLAGRYRDREQEDLRARLALLEGIMVRLGGSPATGHGPLWLEVEMLENALEFDLRPPCGCPPNKAFEAA